MDIINFSKADCSNCYRCVRECPVKAIKLKDGQAEIVNSLCIGCGRCLLVCPKNAKQIKSDISIVKKHIRNGDVVVASVAPSFIAAFDFKYPEQFVSALKQIGFSYVEQTAVGAGIISESYNEYYNKDDDKNYITTSCTAVNYLIQHYYPNLVDEMIPVVSPMVCHAKMLKEKYGQNIKTVFIGPCLAKKLEALREETIDYILTFDEMIKWFENEKIVLDDLEPIPFDLGNKEASLYPITQGIASTLDDSSKKDIFCVDGIENCIDLLKCMDKGKIKNTFIEMSLCDNSCINGPAMPNENSVYIRKNKVKKYVQNCRKNNDNFEIDIEINKDIDISTNFRDLSPIVNIPSEEEIKEILASTGKLKESDE
ncbi:MAG TPA: [Fe-Fe] hydrogenase large subunit C-terminal domain-containing protein, partial [Peptostreptococcaceae bacterium]|nr:[Fe-Fe] hydrogenase large subunit C-terminal domain-containing protein [Peptostreptococcaceae bacterium]